MLRQIADLFVLCQFLPLLSGQPAGFTWRNTLSEFALFVK
jgi:hypothetical protein